MKKKKGRFSKYLTPILKIIDVGIINYFILSTHGVSVNSLVFSISLSIIWLIISAITNFYRVYRFTPQIKIFNLIIIQYIIFLFSIFSVVGIFLSIDFQHNLNGLDNFQSTLIISSLIVSCIAIFKFVVYNILLRFRAVFGGNYRKTVIVGASEQAQDLANYFAKKKEAGFKLKKIFNKKSNIKAIKSYILENSIDEIYCCLTSLETETINRLTNFAESNLRDIKYIPSHKKIYSKKLAHQNYGTIPVLSLRTIHIEDPFNSLVKRSFDIIFSLFVLLFLLSWLTPILAILIKTSSKGPVFFYQKRNGYNFNEFNCFKFRSMLINKEANTMQATRNDLRVTAIGKILRKYSIDELPQFYNVLIGDMSVVGPRPHMIKENEKYRSTIDKFMVRHYVRPGITGLAQTRGFRGEIETDEDIINRVKNDIYYIENWSFLLDIKIIFSTIFNAISGEKKAY